MDSFEAELHAIALRASPEFRVLRKLARRMIYDRPLPAKIKTGLIVDVETTGLNPHTDEIIEIGMLRFAYTPGGTVLGLLADFSAFREPSRPIPDEILRMTGITNRMVAGHRIRDEQIRSFVEPADIVIAHNAGFDRRFCERLCPVFVTKPWACSQTQIPWSSEGVEGTKLFYIGVQQGFWFEGHRALDDCYALLEILERPLLVSGQGTLQKLLEVAREPTFRIWALGAPFQIKNRLKARGYRWNLGEDGQPRAWHRDVAGDQVETELKFLDSLGFPDLVEPLVVEMDAYLRFSDRQA